MHRRPTDVIPDLVEGYQAILYRYHDEMVRLLRALMHLTACALDLPPSYFDPEFFGEGGVGPEHCVGECSLRLAYYPNKDGGAVADGSLRYGEHTDYTGFTILWQDHNVAGPQTAREGCHPPNGGLQVWTNDTLLSNMHRVTNPPPDDLHDRISLVFFTGPRAGTVVRCLPTCCGPDRPEHYAPITAGEHLVRKLAASNK